MDDSDLNARFDQLDGRFLTLEELIKTEGLNTRRHFDVVAAELRSQVKLITEDHTILNAYIVDMRSGIERLEASQTSLALRVSVVESRVTDIEKTQKIMLAKVRSLAACK